MRPPDWRDADDAFRDRLWVAIDDAGLIPSDATYLAVRTLVARRGEQTWARLRTELGEAAWTDAVRSLGRPFEVDAAERILGFGWLLGRFMAAPLDLGETQSDQVADVAGLANIVVALYDELLDRGAAPRDLMPSDRLAELMGRQAAGRSRPSVPISPRAAPSAGVVDTLAGLYFDRLAALDGSLAGSPARGAVLTAISRMYAAENELAASRHTTINPLRRRVAGIPFLVMALPAHVVLHRDDPNLCRWHALWSYRLGRFFGWLDDAIDQDDDIALGRANSIEWARTARGARGWGAAPSVLAHAIAADGARAMREWGARVPPRGRVPPEIAAAVPATIYSWFGASRSGR